MKAILAEKIGMTQFFTESGDAVAVTVVRATPNRVVRVKTEATDRYTAVELGYKEQKEERLSKAERGHLRGIANLRYLREFRCPKPPEGVNRGDTVDVSAFTAGDHVKVSGVTKAKGFQGVVKRHHFKGASKTHGTKHAHRQPGSIGGGGRAGGRVVKGMRMAGRMGGVRASVRNLKVMNVDLETHTIAIAGAIPGRRGTLLEIRG